MCARVPTAVLSEAQLKFLRSRSEQILTAGGELKYYTFYVHNRLHTRVAVRAE